MAMLALLMWWKKKNLRVGVSQYTTARDCFFPRAGAGNSYLAQPSQTEKLQGYELSAWQGGVADP